MIEIYDQLLCISGNKFYTKGSFYTVGAFVNDKYFQIMTGCNDEHWYATVDREGIRVCFDTEYNELNDAWFCKVDMKQLA